MTDAAVMIQMLGPFQILKLGKAAPLRPGGKAEQLLRRLALNSKAGMDRDALIEAIWPDVRPERSIQSLNTLVHDLKSQFAHVMDGQPPVVHTQSQYVLNLTGPLTVDTLEFEQAIDAGHRLLTEGATESAIRSYERAVQLYRGDLSPGTSVSELLERERLRAVCLTALSRLADAHFDLGNYEHALSYAARLLSIDPCREDAHRMTMRAYVRLGARSQALRQYNTCHQILADEFDATPEPATEALFAALRTDPSAV